MKQNNLSSKGLSLSQAQSISNLIFQKAREIERELEGINNYSRTVRIGSETYTETVAKPIPVNASDLIVEKAKLHATQAFLMENIKAKEELLQEMKRAVFTTKTEVPELPKVISPEVKKEVNEKWGWEQLSVDEYNQYLESEAMAAHIGQFIHKGSILDRLRDELPSIKPLEWIEIETGKKTPVTVVVHHTSEKLLELHNSLAAKHREHEQRVNYFKAKVKNLVTLENAKIARENAVEIDRVNKLNTESRLDYSLKHQAYLEGVRKEKEEFEVERQEEIKRIAQLRIAVDPRFQPVIDLFLKQTEEK